MSWLVHLFARRRQFVNPFTANLEDVASSTP
jgi:hypothetical protein